MSVGPEEVRAANARADAARARFRGALAFARNRASPARIKSDVVDGAKARIGTAERQVQATVRRHPVAISSVIAAVLALVFRKPLSALAAKSWDEAKQLKHRLEKERNL